LRLAKIDLLELRLVISLLYLLLQLVQKQLVQGGICGNAYVRIRTLKNEIKTVKEAVGINVPLF